MCISLEDTVEVDSEGLEVLQTLFKGNKGYSMALILQRKSSGIIEISPWFKNNSQLFYEDEASAKEFLFSSKKEEVEAEGGHYDDDFRREA